MKMKKRLTALLLAFCMICSSGPVSVSAADEEIDLPVFFEDAETEDIWFEDDFGDSFGENDLFIEEDFAGEQDEEEAFTDDADAFPEMEESAAFFEETDDTAAGNEETDDAISVPEEMEFPEAEDFSDETESIISEAEEIVDTGWDFGDADYELAGAGTPADVENATQVVTEALKLYAEDQGGLAALESIVNRFSGVTDAASGAISILQMLGIIEDPTQAALSTILSEVRNIEDTLHNMDVKLDSIAVSIIQSQVRQEEIERAKAVRDHIKSWQDFNTNYTEKLDTMVSEYSGYITRGINEWWGKGTHDGIIVCYTLINGAPSLTYSNAAFGSGIPGTADNGEAVSRDDSIGIPSEYMPDTASAAFDVNSYSETFAGLMVDALIKAADDHALDASDLFYAQYEGLKKDTEHPEALKVWLKSYARDALSTVIYRVSCDVMTKNDQWVIGVMEKYKEYCNNIRQVNNGIDALINSRKKSYAFEGEVKDMILDICSSMVAKAGYYGIFALNAAAQDSLQANSAKTALRDTWVKTVLYLDGLKTDTSVLTGHDNFCYITGSLLNYETRTLYSAMTLKHIVKNPTGLFGKTTVCANGFTASDWQILDADGNEAGLPSAILDGVCALVLYDQYSRQKGTNPGETFSQYLNKNGVGIPEDFSGNLVTKYTGIQTFSLDDGLVMKQYAGYGDWFDGHENQKKDYRINKENSSKIKDKNFPLHEKVVCDLINISTGALSVNQTVTARAAFLEAHSYWIKDEGHVFAAPDSNVNSDEYEDDVKYGMWETKHYWIADVEMKPLMSMLSLTPVSADSAPNSSPNSSDSIHSIHLHDMEEEPAYSAADWRSFIPDSCHFYDEADEEKEISLGLELAFDQTVRAVQNEGTELAFSDEQRADYAARMKEMIYAYQSEMAANPSLRYLDVFGINGNEAAELALAKEVLPGSYFDQDGRLKMTAENMDTTARYEAGAMIHFEESGSDTQAVINPLTRVEPVLVIWDPVLEEFAEYLISDEVMKTLGLTMKARISAASLDEGTSPDVIRYDDMEEMNIMERTSAAVYGTGSGRYAEISMGSIGPVELLVTPLKMSIQDAEVRLSRKLFTWNGKVQKPGVRTIGGKILKAGTDYTLAWSDASSKNPGTYTVTITGKGAYKGTTKAEYRIRKAKNPLTVTRKKAEKKLSVTKLAKGAQTVTASEMMAVGKAEGTVTYQLVSAAPAKYKSFFSINKKTGVITVKKGLRKGSYKLKVRVVAAGNDCYNGISRIVVFRIEVR